MPVGHAVAHIGYSHATNRSGLAGTKPTLLSEELSERPAGRFLTKLSLHLRALEAPGRLPEACVNGRHLQVGQVARQHC